MGLIKGKTSGKNINLYGIYIFIFLKEEVHGIKKVLEPLLYGI
jgi:hypothetical protein